VCDDEGQTDSEQSQLLFEFIERAVEHDHRIEETKHFDELKEQLVLVRALVRVFKLYIAYAVGTVKAMAMIVCAISVLTLLFLLSCAQHMPAMATEVLRQRHSSRPDDLMLTPRSHHSFAPAILSPPSSSPAKPLIRSISDDSLSTAESQSAPIGNVPEPRSPSVLLARSGVSAAMRNHATADDDVLILVRHPKIVARSTVHGALVSLVEEFLNETVKFQRTQKVRRLFHCDISHLRGIISTSCITICLLRQSSSSLTSTLPWIDLCQAYKAALIEALKEIIPAIVDPAKMDEEVMKASKRCQKYLKELPYVLSL